MKGCSPNKQKKKQKQPLLKLNKETSNPIKKIG